MLISYLTLGSDAEMEYKHFFCPGRVIFSQTQTPAQICVYSQDHGKNPQCLGVRVHFGVNGRCLGDV